MLVILTGREQLTVKVDYDQNETFVYSMEVQNHCVVVKIILSFVFFFCFFLFIEHIGSLIIFFMILFCLVFFTW